MRIGQLTLGFLTVCLCMWVANAATGTTTTTTEASTTTTTTTAATTTTTTASTTTTTTTAASTVKRKRFRISNLKFSATRRYKIYRSTTSSSRSRSKRLRSRRLVKVLRRSNTRG